MASLIREAVDARFGAVTRADREQAIEEISKMEGRFFPPDELNRLIGEERDAQLRRILEPDGS